MAFDEKTSETYEAKAAELRKFIITGKEEVMPKVCMMIATHLWGGVCRFFQIEKAAMITPQEENLQSKNWPMLYKATHIETGKTLLILDRILTSEEGQSYITQGFMTRLLCVAGIKRFVIVTDLTATDQFLTSGDLVLVKEHCGFCTSNPLVGPNINQWGTRFPDVGKIYTKPSTKSIRRELKKRCGIKTVNALWIPSIKGYHDKAEKILAKEFLKFEVVSHKGFAEAVIAHHHNLENGQPDEKEIFCLGVISVKSNDDSPLLAHSWSSIVKFFSKGF